MKILIVYSSNSGSTFLMAENIFEKIKKHCKSTRLIEAQKAKATDAIDQDLIILGSPSWLTRDKEGQPTEMMMKFLDDLKSLEEEKRYFTAFGAGDSSYTFFCGAVDVMREKMTNLGYKEFFSPLKTDEFFFNREENIKKTLDWTDNLIKSLKTSAR